jgi:hypothetical protein
MLLRFPGRVKDNAVATLDAEGSEGVDAQAHMRAPFPLSSPIAIRRKHALRAEAAVVI